MNPINGTTSRTAPRIVNRSANGFFEVPTDDSPRYIRNPETGVYERDYSNSPNSTLTRPAVANQRDNRADARAPPARSPPLRTETRSETRRVRSPAPRSPRDNNPSTFDDLLKEVDELNTTAARKTTRSRAKSPEPIRSPRLDGRKNGFDFNQMTDSLDEMIDSPNQRRRGSDAGFRDVVTRPSSQDEGARRINRRRNDSDTEIRPSLSKRSDDLPARFDTGINSRRGSRDRTAALLNDDIPTSPRERRKDESPRDESVGRRRSPPMSRKGPESEETLRESRRTRETREDDYSSRRVKDDDYSRRRRDESSPAPRQKDDDGPTRRVRDRDDDSRRTLDDTPRRSRGSPRTPQPAEEEPVMSAQEIKDMEKLREEKLQKEKEIAEADKREKLMIAKERERRMQEDQQRRDGRRGSTQEFALVSGAPVDESLLVPDYLTALMTTLRNDTSVSVIPENFATPEAYNHWRTTMKRSLQEVLIKMIKYRFLTPPDPQKPGFEPVKIRFKIIQAQGLIGKEGRTRSTYCNIEFGDLAALKKQNRNAKEKEVYRTDVIEDSLDPVWNQKLSIEANSITDEAKVEVWDKVKDHFLGQVIVKLSDVITKCTRNGSYESWIDLSPRDGKNKDKYVGGRILIGASLREEKKTSSAKSYKEVQSMLNKMQVDNRALFDILLRACLVLDLYQPREGRADVLSPEAVNMLKAWANTWNITDSYQVIAYLKILFEKYTTYAISISDLLKAFHFVYATVKKRGTFNAVEMQMVIELLEQMKEHCSERVVKYKELFPKNQPRGALESTILVLRMIHKFPTFRDNHPEIQESHRDELKIMMTESCIAKFQGFKELSTPFDENDVESVIEGINKLADLVNEEIELDVKYFQPAFAQELDIVRLTAESQLKYFTLTLESASEVLEGDDAVNNAPHLVFDLYKKVREMSDRYASSVPGLNSLSSSYIEGWFAPFMYKWLHQLSLKTIGWVDAAVKADNFEPEGVNEDGVPSHSTSIRDVFAAIYSELELITDLQWSDPVQNAQFFQGFSKSMNTAIEQYCDAITTVEKKTAATTGYTAVTTIANLIGNRSSEPKDIERESCAKLRNVGYAMRKLKEMYRTMNVSAITKTVKNHRKSMAILKKTPDPSSGDTVTGAFKVQASYAENIKPLNKNGTSNPYVIVRVPEGTVVPPPEQLPTKSPKNKSPDAEELPPAPTVLTGNSCELLRSRVINETLNPTWDENFTVILPPVQRLEVAIFSKNLLTADEVAGTAIIDLSVGTRLRRKLLDHQTHDVYVELEPQGRVLLRLTMEGEEEDVDFWFRRTNERLIRTRDAFLRSLVAKVAPHTKDVLTKAIKDNEAAVIPETSWIKSLTAAVQYSDKTNAGHSINAPVSENDAVVALQPLIEYLEKNLETLCSQIPKEMAQEVISRIWVDSLLVASNSLIPPLFGLHSQKVLNVRQVSMIKTCIAIIRDFLHGDGGEFGLPFSTLDSPLYQDLRELISMYHFEFEKLKREYELSLLGGKDKETILRLVRLKAEKDSTELKWIESQLVRRREQSRR
ncbi:hypothetical protein HK103_003642 [Boothiomyces macroporosus]|uniref:Uncharacterized protein n=1 Tax=Boothiomyces macroporosus TaxID=261099 RepID=A0AAD5UIC0_9FUNG|nr:hypothetical protein HK103_003642 [Boothiomyces macroporosus]